MARPAIPPVGEPPTLEETEKAALRALDGSDRAYAVYLAKLTGLRAARAGRAATDCPFPDPDMRRAWTDYHTFATRGEDEARHRATSDLFQTEDARP